MVGCTWTLWARACRSPLELQRHDSLQKEGEAIQQQIPRCVWESGDGWSNVAPEVYRGAHLGWGGFPQKQASKRIERIHGAQRVKAKPRVAAVLQSSAGTLSAGGASSYLAYS